MHNPPFKYLSSSFSKNKRGSTWYCLKDNNNIQWHTLYRKGQRISQCYRKLMTKIEHLGNIDKGCVVLWQCKVQNGIKSFGVYNFVYETWYLHLLKDRYYQNLNFDKKKKPKSI